MATIVNSTQFTATKSTGVTTYTITIPATTAGNKLVLCAFGGATITAKITNSSGAAFASRGQAASTQAVSIHDFTCVGGETAVFITLNGAENIGVYIQEWNGLGAFGSASTGTPTTATSNDWQSKPSTAISVATNSVIIAAWSVTATAAVAPFSAANTWRQMGPMGKLVNVFSNQPGANGQFVAAVGVADVTATGSYPPDLSAGSYKATSVWNPNSAATWCVQVSYADASGVASVPAPANPIVGENSLPGTDSANWFLGTAGTNANIAGYCDKTSYQPGDTVNFKIDSGNGAFRVEIYRLGWYGSELMGARNVLGNQSGYITGTPTVQSAPSVDGTLGSPSCAWSTNATWTIPANQVPGFYYTVFRSTVTTTNTASCHFVVRPSSVSGKVVSVIPDTTYQAYNFWGATGDNGTSGSGTWTGRSLYQSGADAGTPNVAHRAYAVSFDRPYGLQTSQTNTYVFDSEYAVLMFTEAQGVNLTYLSSIDLENDSSILTKAAVVLMSGHHEYWTSNIYDAFTRAVDAGINLIAIASNTALWHVRFAAGDTQKRTMICYKDSRTADASAGWTGTGYDPGGYTGTWRDTRQNVGTVNNTDIRRENTLTGQLFRVNAPANLQLSVPFANKTAPLWRNSASVQALTTGQSYTTPTSVFGDEGEMADGSSGQPDTLVALCPTAGSWSNGTNAAGSTYTTAVSGNVGFTIYRRHSGALVFCSGAWRGFQGISRWAQGKSPASSPVSSVDTNWQNALLCLLYDLGATPTQVTALRPGIDTAPTDPATGAPAGGKSGVALAYGLRNPAGGDMLPIMA